MRDITDSRLQIAQALATLETDMDSSTDRQGLHVRMEELRQRIQAIPDPVLRTEYTRRLSILRGVRTKVA